MIKYCQGPKCHTYDTTDRKRGPKGNKRNQTRSISTYAYGANNFCTLTCQNDWWDLHGQRAVDHFGRLHNPIILTEENAWRQVYNWGSHETMERNTITREERPLTMDQG